MSASKVLQNGSQQIKIVDPKTVLICTPTYDGTVECGYAGALAACAARGLVGGMHFLIGNSSISGARGKIASIFQDSPYEWLVCIDADIQFTPDDLVKLYQVLPEDDQPGVTRNKEGQELAVTAEYSKKNPQMEPVRFGMGFVRLHRSVFEKLDALSEQLPDGKEGAPELLGRYYEDGKIRVDYFPELCTPDNRKLHEDNSFWTYVRIAEITPRIEQRTKLVHWGKMAFPYGASLGG